jgi:uncharacterized membrane protein YedE/YeeE
MAARVAAAIVGIVFGVILCWSGMSNPDVIREALLLERAYLFLFFASAVLVAAVGAALLQRRPRRALLNDAPLVWSRERPACRHVVGSLLFGLGWGIADACPGPIATQVGQAMPWAAITLVGLLAGVVLFLRHAGTGETEPAVDRAPSPASPATDQPAAVAAATG